MIIKFLSCLITLTLLLAPVRQWFITYQLFCLYLALIALLLALILTPWVRTIAWKMGALDVPNSRKIHQKPVPLLGGVAVYAAFMTVILLNLYYPHQLKAIVIAATLILIIGIVDDLKGLSAQVRLAAQVTAALILIHFDIKLTIFNNTIVGLFLNNFLTFLWIVGITNAVNFFDGMDGLAAGIGAISSLFLGLVALQSNQYLLMLVAFSLMGSCLGFLPYNFKRHQPATIFLGDSGATFIGFMLASLSIMGEWDGSGSIKTFAMPLFIFSLLIFDSIYVFAARIATLKITSIPELLDYSARDHLHHRLAALGFSNWQTVLFIYLLSAILGISAIILKNGRPVDAILGIIQISLMLVSIMFLMRKGGDLLVNTSSPEPLQKIKIIKKTTYNKKNAHAKEDKNRFVGMKSHK